MYFLWYLECYSAVKASIGQLAQHDSQPAVYLLFSGFHSVVIVKAKLRKFYIGEIVYKKKMWHIILYFKKKSEQWISILSNIIKKINNYYNYIDL